MKVNFLNLFIVYIPDKKNGCKFVYMLNNNQVLLNLSKKQTIL